MIFGNIFSFLPIKDKLWEKNLKQKSQDWQPEDGIYPCSILFMVIPQSHSWSSLNVNLFAGAPSSHCNPSCHFLSQHTF